MYYPYLRGKQFELLALREFAEFYSANCNIFPIIEPVKKSFNSLTTAFQKMQEKGISFSIILNPQNGELINDYRSIETFIKNDLIDLNNCRPTFIVNNRNSRYIINKIEELELKNIILICQDNVDTENPDFNYLVERAECELILINGDNRSLRRRLNRIGKVIVRLDDKFNSQKKNSDYINIPEERFTEEHRCYEEDGFNGFADYTVLGSDFIEGGRLPYAVAMHFTYEKNADEIWVRHFVSDTNDDNTNIQGKFGEAAAKAVSFFRSNSINSHAIEELTSYYTSGQYPGLGVLKKLSIKHHLELINSILSQSV
jgi:hypothetical protein